MYAIVEFTNKDLAIVDSATVRNFAQLEVPGPAICSWKKAGSKKASACHVTVLRTAGK